MIIEKFEAKDYEILNVFTRVNASFYVPIYQRKYNWRANEEVEELIDDLKAFRESYDEGSTYYLGNIIVKAEKNKITNKVEKYILIDGQQRLTTILLIVNYLKFSLGNEIKDIDDENKKEKILSLDEILYSSKGSIHEERKLKIENNYSDDILREIFDYTSNLREISNEVKESNYYQNFEFIKNKLNIKSIKEWNFWLEIIKNIRVAQITLGTNDSEISVFESINSKGLKLNALDLIKNYFFLIAERLKLKEDIKTRIDNLFSNKLEKEFTTKNNEKDEKRINRFFAAFLVKEKLIDPTKEWKIIYKVFKNEFKDSFNNKDKFIKLLNNLESTINDYIKLIKEGKDFSKNIQDDNYSKRFLLDSRFELYLPLFLIISSQVKKGTISREDENKIYELLDLHNLSLSVVGRINKDNRFLFSYIKNYDGVITYDTLKEFLIEKGNEGNKSGLVGYDDFHLGFRKSSIYKNDKKTARYILYRIENHLREKSGEKISFDYTLEHIFPQEYEKWKQNYDEDNSEYVSEYIHSLGNLTLVKSKLNSSLSNVVYSKKIVKISESSLKINSYIKDNFDNWNIKKSDNSPEKRSQNLFELLSKIYDFNIFKEVSISETKSDDKLYLINKFDKISIVNAFKIIMFLEHPNYLTLKKLKSKTIDLYDYISVLNEEEDANIDVTFSRDKISTGGWMTERLHSNWSEKSDKPKYEKPIFTRDENNSWTITKETYDKMS